MIRNSANTLASGLASSTNTRAICAKAGEFCASLSTHSEAKIHATGGLAPLRSAIGTATTPIRSTNPDGEKIYRQAVPARIAARARIALSIAK